jgi:hypothetical protein
LLPPPQPLSGDASCAGEAAPTPFLLHEVRLKLLAFLSDGGELRAVLTAEAKAAGHAQQEWQLSASCASCPYLLDCRTEALPQLASGRPATTRALSIDARQRRQLDRAAAAATAGAGAAAGSAPAPADLDRVAVLAARRQPDEQTRRLLARTLQIGACRRPT